MKSWDSVPRAVLPISPLAQSAQPSQDLESCRKVISAGDRDGMRVREARSGGRFWPRQSLGRRSKPFLICVWYLTITRHVKPGARIAEAIRVLPELWCLESGKAACVSDWLWCQRQAPVGLRTLVRRRNQCKRLKLPAVSPCRAGFSAAAFPGCSGHAASRDRESQCRAKFNDIADLPGSPVRIFCFVRPVAV
jgi:hypothetical protein